MGGDTFYFCHQFILLFYKLSPKNCYEIDWWLQLGCYYNLKIKDYKSDYFHLRKTPLSLVLHTTAHHKGQGMI